MFSSHAKSMFSIRFRVGVKLFSRSLYRHILGRESVKGKTQEDVDPGQDMLDNEEKVEGSDIRMQQYEVYYLFPGILQSVCGGEWSS